MTSEYAEIIEECRKKFGKPPRYLDDDECSAFEFHMDLYRKLYFSIRRDEIMDIMRDQNLLRDEGRVVWGHLVQANSVLFKQENTLCCPANVIYSREPFFDENPDQLKVIARKISSMKGKPQRDREMDRISNAVTDEMKREMKLRLPESMCGEHRVYFTSTLIQPSHLPGNRIVDSLFPIVILPEETDSIMILPKLFWSQTLRKAWR